MTGAADAQALVAAVEKAGYGAEMIQDETERRERQQQTARANMKRFSWQAALGLALGIPLMARGLFGGSMTLTPETQRPGCWSASSPGGDGVRRWALLPQCGVR